MSTLPPEMRGDGPCMDCGTLDTPVWFTDNVFWNAVVGGPDAIDDPGGFLCPICFIRRAETVTAPTGWRLTPTWPTRYRGEATPTDGELAMHLLTEAKWRGRITTVMDALADLVGKIDNRHLGAGLLAAEAMLRSILEDAGAEVEEARS